MDIDDGWVALLQERIDEQELSIDVVNASITGDLSGSGKNRIARLLKQHQPKWTIIELGGNDGLRGLPIKHIKNNLSSMIELSQENNSKVIIVGMQIFPNYGPKYTEAFKQIYYEVAQAKNVSFIPFILEGVGGVASLIQADGVHPSEKAQPILLNNVWQTLAPILKDP